MTDKQKKHFTDCQPLAHGQKLYGKASCRDNGFIVTVFTDKDCKSHATKSGRPLKTPIYYGRCHKEGPGVYFVVNRMAPKLNIEEDKEGTEHGAKGANATHGSNHTANATSNATKGANAGAPQSSAPLGDSDDAPEA